MPLECVLTSEFWYELLALEQAAQALGVAWIMALQNVPL